MESLSQRSQRSLRLRLRLYDGNLHRIVSIDPHDNLISLRTTCAAALGITGDVELELRLADDISGGLDIPSVDVLRDDDVIIARVPNMALPGESSSNELRRTRLAEMANEACKTLRALADIAPPPEGAATDVKQIETIFQALISVGGGVDGIALLSRVAATDRDGSGDVNAAELIAFDSFAQDLVDKTAEGMLNVSVVQTLFFSILFHFCFTEIAPEGEDDVDLGGWMWWWYTHSDCLPPQRLLAFLADHSLSLCS